MADLLDLVSRHAEETGSPVATALVDAYAVDPSALLSRVTRVMPRDYRRVLAERGTRAEVLQVSRG